jgi:ribulose-bisphosphate carboxylase large chain
MTHNRVRARYLIETRLGLAATAAAVAGEQSTGTFITLPGETPELVERHAARVEEIVALGEVDKPSLAGATGLGPIERGEVVLSFPLDNIGTALPNLLATVAGNLFELQQLSGIRLIDLELPEEFGLAHPGPQFAMPGTRKLASVPSGPIIGTIVKPSVGLTPSQTGALAAELSLAGLDFIKDDELMADSPHSPFEERLDAVLNALDHAAETTGRRPLYAVNVSGDIDDMRRRSDLVAERGGNCIMVNVNAVGIAGLRDLRMHSSLPIHAHRAGWGALTRDPSLGYSFRVWQQLWRLAGADHIHVSGLRNKFWEPDESVIASARSVLEPINGGPAAVPVFSSAQSADQAADTYAAIGTSDLLYVCGGGIMGHPDGVAAGVASIRQAWDAATSGVGLSDYALTHPELDAALRFFRAARS